MEQNATVGIMDKIFKGVGKYLSSRAKVISNVDIILFDADGNIKDERHIHNTVPNNGLYGIADQLLDAPTVGKPTHMELGTGTPAATKLGSYVVGSRTALATKTRLNAVVTMTCTFAAGVGTGALTEAGIFNGAVEDAGNMYLSASFGVVTKAVTDSLSITWTLTTAAA